MKIIAYGLMTGHGYAIRETKPECEIDLWFPIYDHKEVEDMQELLLCMRAMMEQVLE